MGISLAVANISLSRLFPEMSATLAVPWFYPPTERDRNQNEIPETVLVLQCQNFLSLVIEIEIMLSLRE